MSETIDRLLARARTTARTSPLNGQIHYHSIGDLLTFQVTQYQNKPWLIYYTEDGVRSEFSYSEFYALVCKTANFFRDNKISHGDRVATVSHNHPDAVVQYFAAWLVGAVVVPINVGEDDRRISFILQNAEVKLAFVRCEYTARIEKIRKTCPALTTVVTVRPKIPPGSPEPARPYEPADPDFHSLLQDQESSFLGGTTVGPDDEALIVYTSGTTGNPKGVVLTHDNLLIDAKAITEWNGMTPDQRMMCVLPLHHVNGTIVTLITPLLFGGSVVLNERFQSEMFFQAIATERVSVVSVVPTLLQFLLHEYPDRTDYDLRHLRHIICGAGPLTVELAMKFEARFNIPIIHGYGLSETTCYSCMLPLDLSSEEHGHWLRDYGFPSIGVPLPVNEMAIHDESGHERGEGEKGEIVIRGKNVMKGYFSNPEANEKAFTFGWFRSGDEGFFKTDSGRRRFFFITGRIKELIIRGGMNISPFEIDEVLMNIPGVKVGLAVGFENDWYGEEVGAYVVLKGGITMAAEQIIAHCRKFFPFQKSPKVVVFGNTIPITSTGKYQRSHLKHLFVQWKENQFSESTHPQGHHTGWHETGSASS